jgi:hypothetical protein
LPIHPIFPARTRAWLVADCVRRAESPGCGPVGAGANAAEQRQVCPTRHCRRHLLSPAEMARREWRARMRARISLAQRITHECTEGALGTLAGVGHGASSVDAGAGTCSSQGGWASPAGGGLLHAFPPTSRTRTRDAHARTSTHACACSLPAAAHTTSVNRKQARTHAYARTHACRDAHARIHARAHIQTRLRARAHERMQRHTQVRTGARTHAHTHTRAHACTPWRTRSLAHTHADTSCSTRSRKLRPLYKVPVVLPYPLGCT